MDDFLPLRLASNQIVKVSKQLYEYRGIYFWPKGLYRLISGLYGQETPLGWHPNFPTWVCAIHTSICYDGVNNNEKFIYCGFQHKELTLYESHPNNAFFGSFML